MKAIRLDRYGSSEVLELRDEELPSVGDTDVLVRVRAASLNPYDWHLVTGLPMLARPSMGLSRPKVSGIGVDLAGEVAAVGDAVTTFAVGDEVYGRPDPIPGTRLLQAGAVAEYVRVKPGSIRHRPANVTVEEAAASPMAAIAAIQALRHVAPVRPGMRVLVHGASGGVGTFAVQLAKADGAHVTGVCSTRNIDLVGRLGADEVVDYTTTDVTRTDARFDVVLDNVGNLGPTAWRRVLSPDGTYLASFGCPDKRWLGPFGRMLPALLLNLVVSPRLGMLNEPYRDDDLDILTQLLTSGALRPVVGRTYDLVDTVAAMDQMATEHTRGKLVITI